MRAQEEGQQSSSSEKETQHCLTKGQDCDPPLSSAGLHAPKVLTWTRPSRLCMLQAARGFLQKSDPTCVQRTSVKGVNCCAANCTSEFDNVPL